MISLEQSPDTTDVTGVLSPEELQDMASVGDRDALPVGSALGAYVIDSRIAAGGGGIVYAAHHSEDGRRVAIKVLRSEMASYPSMVKRFIREASAVKDMEHPHIVRIYEFGELRPGLPYYVMELLDGSDLRTLLHDQGRFSPQEVLALLEPVCGAVQAAHEAGIVHRDIKANNIVVVDRDGERIVKLLDFGIAKMLHGEASGQGLTEPGAILGTAHSMAPEQIRCERADERTDIYALGVLIYQLLTGQYPFHAPDPRQIALLHLQAPAPRPGALAAVPPALDAVVLRCMEKQPAKRFASVTELVDALRRAVGETKTDGAPELSRALGIYVALVTEADAEEDEALFEDMCNVLDLAEQTLQSHAFIFPLRTSTVVLGVRPVPTHHSSEMDSAEGIFTELRRAVDERADAHAELRVVVSMTISEAAFRGEGAGAEVVGGAILELSTWTGQDATRVS